MNNKVEISPQLRAVEYGRLTMREAIERNEILKTIDSQYPVRMIFSGWQIHVSEEAGQERSVARFAVDDSVDRSIHLQDFCYYGREDNNPTVIEDSVRLLRTITDAFFQHGYEKAQVDLKRMDFHLTVEQRMEIVEKAGFVFLPFSWEKAVKYSEETLSKTYELEKEFKGLLGDLSVSDYLTCVQASHYYLCAYDYEATLPYTDDKGSLENGMQWISYRAEAIELLEGIKQEKEISALDYEMLKIIISQYEDFQHGITDELENLKSIARTCQSTYFGIQVAIQPNALQTLEEHIDAFVEFYDIL